MTIRPALVPFLLVAVVACGSSASGGDDAGADAQPDGDAAPPGDAAGEDAPPPDDAADAPSACGAATCGAGQVCVHPCCGGALPQCLPADDAGACPPGTSWGQCGGPPFQMGCAPAPCQPDPPFCAPDTGDPASICPSHGGYRSGSEIDCVCA